MKVKISTVIAIVAVLLFAAGSVLAAAPIELLGQWGGSANCVAVSGGKAYVGAGPRMLVLDVSGEGSPTLIGRTDLLSGIPEDLSVLGNVSYVACGGDGLDIIDVSDPSHPVQVNHVSGSAYGVAVAGNYAYVANQGSGLNVYDISVPSSPNLVGSYYSDSYPSRVAVSGTYAYLVGYNRLDVVDISNPLHPVGVGTYTGTQGLNDVAVSGTTAYLAATYDGLVVLDVSDPSNPAKIGGCPHPLQSGAYPGYAYDVVVSGSHVYSCGTPSMAVYDVSTPSAPVITDVFDYGYCDQLAVSGSHVILTRPGSGVLAAAISDPTETVWLGEYGCYGYENSVIVRGNYAYWIDRFAGLRIIDSSDPTNPTEAGSGSAGYGHTAISGDYLYSPGGGIVVTDVSDPSSPTYVNGLSVGGSFSGVAVQGNRAYSVGDYSGFAVTDISNPTNPSLVVLYDAPGQDVAVAGNYAYVAGGSAGLRIVDISDSAHPTQIGLCDTPGSATRVLVSGTVAYVADWSGGLQIIDVSDPHNPSIMSSLSGQTEALDKAGDYLYVVGYARGGDIRVIDVSDPSRPVEIFTYYRRLGRSGDIAVSGNQVYITQGGGGLAIFRVTIPAVATIRETKFMPDFSDVRLNNAIVSATDNGFAYLEADDRSCGIRVEGTIGLSQGSRAIVMGTVRTNADGERYIDAASAVNSGTGSVTALGMPNKSVGGSDFRSSVGSLGQQGISGASGLSNIGIYVRVWGTVTAVGIGYMYTDDGSNLKDGTSTNGVANIGLRVVCDSSDYVVGHRIKVTGVSSCFRTSPTQLARQIVAPSVEVIPTYGSLQVTMGPQGAIDDGAKWRFVGSSTWLDSGTILTDYPVGKAWIEFRDIEGWFTPEQMSVIVRENELTNASASYTQMTPMWTSGHYSTSSPCIDISGNIAVMGIGHTLAVLDISNPANPALLGEALPERMYEYVNDVAISGSCAYAAKDSLGLVIFDISDPTRPRRMGNVWTGTVTGEPSSCAVGIVVSGDYAYVMDEYGGFVVVDITNPSYPVRVASLPPTRLGTGITLAGHYAYVTSEGGMGIVDISDPCRPKGLVKYATPTPARKIAVSGVYAYVTCDSSIEILNVSDPRIPVFVGRYTKWPWESDFSSAVAFRNEYSYVGMYGRWRVMDFSNPQSPLLVSDIGYGESVHDIALSGNHAFLATERGLKVMDISSADSPELVGGWDTGSTRNVSVSGNYAYVLNDAKGLEVFDVSKDTSFLRVGGCALSLGYPRALELSGGYAYVAGNYGLDIVNIVAPTNPALTSSWHAGDWVSVQDIKLLGNNALLACRDDGLRVVNVSDPTHPVPIGSYTASGANGVAVSGDYAYVTDAGGVYVLDCSNPAGPVRIGSCAVPGGGYPIALDGNYVYVGGYDSWGDPPPPPGVPQEPALVVINVSDPANPRLVKTLPVGHDTANGRILVSGDHLLMSLEWGGLLLIDVSDPTSPVLAGRYEDYASGLFASGDCAFVAAGSGGLRRVSWGSRPAPTLSSVTPSTVPNLGITHFTDIAGSGFQPGAEIVMWTDGRPLVWATNVVVVDEHRITCDIDLTGVAPGLWSVAVVNIDDQYGVMENALTVSWTVSYIALSKSFADGAYAQSFGGRVTAAWTDCFYIESEDRRSAIRVEKTAHGLQQGDMAGVVGKVQTNSDGERYIGASSAFRVGNGTLQPLGMPNRSLGGGDWHYQSDTGAGQRGIEGAVGLNNIALLVRIWGRIVGRDTSNPPTWFTINDGSGADVKCTIPAGVVIDDSWQFVAVTGISSCEKVGEELHPLLRVRTREDIGSH